MGVKLQGPVAIVRPEERVRHVEIPGRSGDLTELEGDAVYNSYIQTATIMVQGGFRVREVYRWLRGSGYVTFHGEPDRRQKARIIGAVTLNRHSYNLDWWVGEVQFYCDPLKEKMVPEKVTLTATGTVNNTGDVDAYPMIKATVSGSGSGKTVEVASGGNTLQVGGLTGGSVIRIDCGTMEVTNADGTALLTANSAGSFPVLKPGINTFSMAGAGSVEIEKRERFL